MVFRESRVVDEVWAGVAPFIAEETEKWAGVIKFAGIKAV